MESVALWRSITVSQKLLALFQSIPEHLETLGISRAQFLETVLSFAQWFRGRCASLFEVLRASQLYSKICTAEGHSFAEQVDHLKLFSSWVFLHLARLWASVDQFVRTKRDLLQMSTLTKLGAELAKKEVVWWAFGELILFVVPMISLRRVILLRARLPAAERNLVEQLDYCAVCRLKPTAPHQANCAHIFCYECIRTSSLADSMFRCPCCDKLIESIHPTHAIDPPVVVESEESVLPSS